ncbi:sensor histidine kinase KdpD [Nostoc sp. FACHB-190]|uniref:sensor histidine kinase n=1 Tax=Nostoc sp. FACHB-190 TaxID=2692838 RepID=UPI001685D32C|nr:sensor histidine kinase [Nostoc sp. FACHB-190]MBD2303822.1 sensor histidine kinase [Nostoc sp. FACHB-190]
MSSLTDNVNLSAFVHDVLNGLGSTSLILNQLINGVHGLSQEEVKSLLSAVLQTNNRIVNLVEAQKVNPTNFVSRIDMLFFLQNLYLEFSPLAQARSLGLHYVTMQKYKHGTTVVGDTTGLERMLSNLLQNAINYTESGDIFLRLANQDNNLVIEIEDTGIGIAPENLENMFRPLWRSLDSQGSGLGLYVVKSVAIAHDSQETHCVESEMGVSSKPKAKAFFLRLLTTRSRYRCS